MSKVRKAEETPLWLPGKLDTTLGVVLPVTVEVMVVAIAVVLYIEASGSYG